GAAVAVAGAARELGRAGGGGLRGLRGGGARSAACPFVPARGGGGNGGAVAGTRAHLRDPGRLAAGAQPPGRGPGERDRRRRADLLDRLGLRGPRGARRRARAAGRRLRPGRRPAGRAFSGGRPGRVPPPPRWPARVRFAYCASAALRYCVALTTWLVRGINPDGTSADVGGLRNPGQRALFESFFERPFTKVQQEFGASFRFLATGLGAEALELLPPRHRTRSWSMSAPDTGLYW